MRITNKKHRIMKSGIAICVLLTSKKIRIITILKILYTKETKSDNILA
jgi:hypothetical protein